MARLQVRWLFPVVVAAAPLLLGQACSASDRTGSSSLPSGVFGGAAGVVEPDLAGAAGGSTGPPDVCAAVPQGTRALVDDFDDGDSVAVLEPEREAYWFPTHDDSAGMMNQPNEFTPLPGGANGSPYAAHIIASGYTAWGASFQANISHLADGIRCAYNASAFSGFRFYAKGSGVVRVELSMPEVIDVLYGGKCDPSTGDVCYDTHGVTIALGADWQAVELGWSSFTQRGYGKPIAFDPGKIMSIEFAFETPTLPVDVWLDDVGFMDGSPFPDPAPSGTQSGNGGDGASAGDATDAGDAGDAGGPATPGPEAP